MEFRIEKDTLGKVKVPLDNDGNVSLKLTDLSKENKISVENAHDAIVDCMLMLNLMKIINVVGTRPNFMKIAPIIREMNKSDKIEHILVHTGQHYDTKMSQNFFDELEIPQPNVHLEVGSHSHTKQTAKIMTRKQINTMFGGHLNRF